MSTTNIMINSEVENILIVKCNGQEKIFTLNDQPFSVGRHPSNSLVIQSQLISRYHTTIFPVKSAVSHNPNYWVVDGNLEKGIRSSNGISVNGHPCSMQQLTVRDIIVLPDQTQIIYDKALKTDDDNTTSLLDDQGIDSGVKPSPTLVKFQAKLADLDHPNLMRIVSFAELNPWPIIEIDYTGTIVYANPVTFQWFRNIEKGKEHPIIKQILESCNNHNSEEDYFSIEIENENNFFEVYIHNLRSNQVIRSYIKHITRRIRAEKMLEYKAYHDELTGLYNRLYFTQKVSKLIKEASLNFQKLAVLFLDLDRFKNINDSLGHQFGDLVLQNFALRLKESVTENDLVARWGGDEFIILLTQISDVKQIHETLKRLMSNIREVFHIHKYHLHLLASIGISIYPDDGHTEDILIQHADAALYRTKEQGRNNYQFYNQSMTSKAEAFLSLENYLTSAIKNQELLVYYQPQINLKTKQVCGLEALLRWKHPMLGMISPTEFIPLAEEVGLIVTIGEWILRAACQQNRQWQRLGFNDLKIAVNLSAQQLYQDNFVQLILNILEENELNPNSLELEITETALIENTSQVRTILTDLQSFGINITLDDFGTGYSSLIYLKQFAFDKLKLDRSFIQHLGKDEQDLAIVSAVMVLAEKFNLDVVAEGVENEQQLEILANLHCYNIQGYFYSKPLPAEEITKFLEQYRQ